MYLVCMYEAVSEWVTEIVLHEDKNHSTGLTMSELQIKAPNDRYGHRHELGWRQTTWKFGEIEDNVRKIHLGHLFKSIFRSLVFTSVFLFIQMIIRLYLTHAWLHFVLFSPTGPSGPSWSSSHDVRLCVCVCVCLSVPFPCDFFRVTNSKVFSSYLW